MRKLAIIILDGWGIGEKKENNAIHVAQTPFFDYLWNNFPHTQLQASGEYVGLPQGQIGGSEVGHLTIGAGRVIFQELPRITRSLQMLHSEESVLNITEFKEFIALAQKQSVHLIGLISPGGVHSHQNYLYALLHILKEHKAKSPVIHFISDGRDTPPRVGITAAKALITELKKLNFGTIATLSGRFWSMDRDKNMDRTMAAVDLYTQPQHDKHVTLEDFTMDYAQNLIHAFELTYNRDITDEFIEPSLIDPSFTGIKPGETLFFFNFRSDRMKQLVTALHEKLPENKIFTMTQYDKSYTYPVIFKKRFVDNTIGEILSNLNLTQLRSTETEKAPHVTYFFNGGIEVTFKGEHRSITPSNKVKHDLIPEMKAAEIYESVKQDVEKNNPDFVFVNFANPDMVGHTGNFQAVVKGVQKVDQELKAITQLLAQHGYIVMVTADHGNADIMYDLQTNEPHTAHTLNPVPFIVYDSLNSPNQYLKLDQNPANGLHKIAGTALELMELGEHNQYETLLTNKK